MYIFCACITLTFQTKKYQVTLLCSYFARLGHLELLETTSLLRTERQYSYTITEVGLSLIPRPSLAPVFDRLQYANMEGEGLVNLIPCDPQHI